MVAKELMQINICADEEKFEWYLEFIKTGLCGELNMDSGKLKLICDNFAKELELLIK